MDLTKILSDHIQWPTKKQAINYSGDVPLIKVYTYANDVHKAGDKYRCRWFKVVGVIKW